MVTISTDTLKISEDGLILVTGASGYIASHLVKQLLEAGYKVRGTVRKLSDEKKVSHLRNLVPDAKYPLELVEADLLNDDSWLAAIQGCTCVHHTASPFPNAIPDDENELIKPAVNGTLSVFKACVQENSTVKKVVLTSSIVAIFGDFYEHGKTYTEKDWSDLTKSKAYAKSKTLAEKAAWDFIDDRKKNNQPCFELAVINPSFVMGPVLHNTECTSMEIVRRLMLKEMPMLPNIYFATCDVRDVAKAHIQAMVEPDAINNRHIIATTVEANAVKEYAELLSAEFGPKGYSVPTMVAPNFLIKMFSLFDKSVRMITPSLGVKYNFDNSRMKNVLKIEPIPLKNTLIDMANSMIEKNFISKK